MSQPQYAQRVVPCPCGSREAYWHGPDGLREYCCNLCWLKRSVPMTRYRIELLVPDDVDPSRVLEAAQELCVDLLDDSDTYDEDEDHVSEDAIESLKNEVSVEVVQ